MIWTPFQILQLVLPVFLVILAGTALRRARILTSEADRSLLGVLIKLFVPCLAFDVILGNEALARPANLLLPPLLGFGLVTLGFGISWVIARMFSRDAKLVSAFAVSAGLPNYGYIPLPLCQALFDREVVGVLFAFNVGVEIAMWTTGVLLFARGNTTSRWRSVINPPVIAVLAALGLNALGVGKWVPGSIDASLHMLGMCAVPVGLILFGATLSDQFSPRIFTGGWGVMSGGLLVRLGILPLTLLGAALLLPLEPPLQFVLAVQAAMPSAVFPVVLAKMYHGDVNTALRVVFATSLAGLATIPLWLAFGLHWLGAPGF